VLMGYYVLRSGVYVVDYCCLCGSHIGSLLVQRHFCITMDCGGWRRICADVRLGHVVKCHVSMVSHQVESMGKNSDTMYDKKQSYWQWCHGSVMHWHIRKLLLCFISGWYWHFKRWQIRI
jgi:hypothetical protein